MLYWIQGVSEVVISVAISPRSLAVKARSSGGGPLPQHFDVE